MFVEMLIFYRWFINKIMCDKNIAILIVQTSIELIIVNFVKKNCACNERVLSFHFLTNQTVHDDISIKNNK